jgi:hypothetical protein
MRNNINKKVQHYNGKARYNGYFLTAALHYRYLQTTVTTILVQQKTANIDKPMPPQAPVSGKEKIANCDNLNQKPALHQQPTSPWISHHYLPSQITLKSSDPFLSF